MSDFDNQYKQNDKIFERWNLREIPFRKVLLACALKPSIASLQVAQRYFFLMRTSQSKSWNAWA